MKYLTLTKQNILDLAERRAITLRFGQQDEIMVTPEGWHPSDGINRGEELSPASLLPGVPAPLGEYEFKDECPTCGATGDSPCYPISDKWRDIQPSDRPQRKYPHRTRLRYKPQDNMGSDVRARKMPSNVVQLRPRGRGPVA